MKCVRDNAYKIVTRGELIPCATERDIFEVLGLAYREPWERPLFDRKSMIIRPISEAIKGSNHNTTRRSATKPGNSGIDHSQQLSADKVVRLPKENKDEEASVLGKRPSSQEN